MSEADLMRRIQMKASELGSRLFRNNVAFGWVGTKVRHSLGAQYTVLKNARRLRAGLTVGSSDLIGWTPVVITPEMVGRTVGIFTATEVKAGSPTTNEQMSFLIKVIKDGGIGIVAKRVEDIYEIHREFKSSRHKSDGLPERAS